jgi:hypothetical protein
VPELLSEEWFGALGAVLDGLGAVLDGLDEEPVPAGRDTEAIALGQIVTGVPDDSGAAGIEDGQVRYTIVLTEEGLASLVRGSTEQADVVLVEDWATAKAVASREMSVSDLLTLGRIKVRGDSRALVTAGDLLGRVAPLIAAAVGGAEAR